MLEAMARCKSLLIANVAETASRIFACASDIGLLFKAGDPEDLAARLEPITSSMKNGDTFDPLIASAISSRWEF